MELYGTPKMGVLAALGFGGGVPNVLVTTVAVAWTTKTGWSTLSVATLTAACGLPYIFKFLWAPVLDKIEAPVFHALGRRRSWMMFAAVGMLVPMVLAAFLGGENGPFRSYLWGGLIVLIAFLSATYDVASDAYRADILRKEEMGAGASMFVSAYRLALVLVSAAVLALVAPLGWALAWLVGATGVLAALYGVRTAREPASKAVESGSMVLAPVRALWLAWRWRIVALAFFVLLFRLPDQMGNALSLPFLLTKMQFEVDAIAYIRQALGLGATVVGAMIGGWMVARLGIVKCLWVFGVIQAATNGGYLALAAAFDAGMLQPHADAFGGGAARVGALSGVLALENFAGGMVASGFVAFLMSLCDHRFTAAQYALLTALVALGSTLGVQLGGFLPDALGWSGFFIVTIVAGVPGVALISLVKAPPAPLSHTDAHCDNCGYLRRGIDSSQACPECGHWSAPLASSVSCPPPR
jgi:PAT family beta-lactamase induction signal transducer AmpG